MEITVFCYHNALPELLDKDLAFLQANGYETLFASQVVDVLAGRTPPPERGVALTFDDGLVTLKTAGLPLFERYGARATVFAITGLTPDGVVAPAGERDKYELLGWGDLRHLRDSGLVEIGSHGHRHNPVHVADEPGAPLAVRDYKRLYDVPVPFTPACDAAAIAAADGKPSRPSRPLFDTERVLVDGDVAGAAPLVASDLQASADALRQRLGVERLHLCLPYGRGNEAIPQLARGAGFESVFWTRRDDRAANRPGDDPYRIVRRKHDYVRRLPGRGRRSALDVLVGKVKRRLTSDPWE